MTQRGDKQMVDGASQKKVVISNLKRDVDEDALAALCRQLGRVTNFRLTPGHSPDSPMTAVVEYATPEEARDVVDHVDGRLVLGQPVTATVTVTVPGASYRQSTASTLPPRIPPPPGVNNSAPTSTGQARAPYPVMEDRNVDYPQGKDDGTPPYARYPRPKLNNPPRQFQPPPYARVRPWEQDQRAPERAPLQPPTGFGEDFPHGQKQPPWAGRPRRENTAGPSAPKFNEDVRHNPRTTENPRVAGQQWQSHGEISRNSESLRWEREGGRNNYPMQRASSVEHPEFYSHSSSAWAAGTDARPPLSVANGVGTGQRPPPPPQRVPGAAADSRGPPGIAPHDPRGGNGYVDGDAEGVAVGKRRRTSPPDDGRGPPVPSDSTSAWREGPRHPAPPPESTVGGSTSVRDPAFDREVLRQAALLVAEREILARENARKQTNVERVRPDEPVLQHRRQARGNTTAAKSTSMGHRRSRSIEDADRRKREGHGSRERRQRDGRDGDAHSGRNSDRDFDHQTAAAVGGGNWREDSKRSRRDNSPYRAGHGRVDDRAGKGRAEERANERRVHSDRKYVEENSGISGSKYRDDDTPGSRQDDRWNNKDRRYEHRARRDSRGRTSNSSREPDMVASRAEKTWERGNRQVPLHDEAHTRRPGEVDGSREAALGPSLYKNWEQSSADSGWYVHVGGISFSTTFTALAKRFAAFGDVNGFKVIFNNVTCRAADNSDSGHERASKKDLTKAAVVTASTGFAFISFDDEEGMERAIECMNNQVLDGHVLKVSRGRMLTESFNSKPRPPALKSDRRWHPPEGSQELRRHNSQSHHFHSPHQDRADRRPTPSIHIPAPFAKKSWPGAGPSSTAPGPASSHRNAGGGGEGVGGLAASANSLSARPAGTSRVPTSGPSRAEASTKSGDRRDPRDRDAGGRSRHGSNDNAFGGYGVDAGGMGDGGRSKTKRGVRGEGNNFRDRARGGGDGSSKNVDKRANKEGANDDMRPRDGQAGHPVSKG